MRQPLLHHALPPNWPRLRSAMILRLALWLLLVVGGLLFLILIHTLLLQPHHLLPLLLQPQATTKYCSEPQPHHADDTVVVGEVEAVAWSWWMLVVEGGGCSVGGV